MIERGRISSREREAPLQTVRKMLRKSKRTWADLRSNTKCSPTTLSKILKELEKAGEIKSFRDSKDGRITWYEAVGKQITAQIKRFDSARFLEELKNPSFGEKNDVVDGYKIQMSSFYEGLQESKEKETIEAVLSSFDVVAAVISLASNMSNIDKFALVVTAEKIQDTSDKEKDEL